MSALVGARRLFVIADFNVSNLQALLARSTDPVITPLSAPFGNLFQSLLDPPAAEAAFVWARPEAVSPAFAAHCAHEIVPLASILEEVDAFINALLAARSRLPLLLVAAWTSPSYQRGLGMLDLKADGGIGRSLLAMNSRLVERLATVQDVFVLDASRWARAAGSRGESPASWYAAKMPYTPDALRIVAADVRAALRGASGGARKLLIVDLDDTLWGGIVGDLGWENLALGGHDPRGESHQDFQRALRALARRGVVLAIASKNDEGVALQAIREHPEMVLRERDFAAWRINWRDKAANITEIAAELNLGLQHVVFIDDNPAERGRVREALPEVLVPDWPTDPRAYVSALGALDCFDAPAITEEDRERGPMYAAERQRTSERDATTSVEEWLAALELVVTVERLRPVTLARATQLLNKTNQMNVTTRRFSESSLEQWAGTPGNAVWTVSVADRFGAAGLTGVFSVTCTGEEASLEDLVLSCRVFGRRVEEAMLHVAVGHATETGARSLAAHPVPTAKNKPTFEFLRDRSGLRADASGVFRWDCGAPYPLPTHIRLDREPAS